MKRKLAEGEELTCVDTLVVFDPLSSALCSLASNCRAIRWAKSLRSRETALTGGAGGRMQLRLDKGLAPWAGTHAAVAD